MINAAQIEADALIFDLKANYERLGLRASGKWAEMLTSEIKQSNSVLHIIIKGLNYTQWIENGRKGGKYPPKEVIEDWVKEKNLSYDIPFNSLVFLIRRKIATKGWTVPNEHNAGGLVSDVITNKRMNEIVVKVGGSYLAQKTSDVLKQFKA